MSLPSPMASLAVASTVSSSSSSNSSSLLPAALHSPLKTSTRSAFNRRTLWAVCAAAKEEVKYFLDEPVACRKLANELDIDGHSQIVVPHLNHGHENATLDVLKPFGRLIPMTTLGASLLTVTLPAYALDFDLSPDFLITLATGATFAFLYFLAFPLLLYYYLEKRWFKRRMAEAILQFGLVFLFFPGMLLLAPFINFRALPRDGAKEPWDEI